MHQLSFRWWVQLCCAIGISCTVFYTGALYFSPYRTLLEFPRQTPPVGRTPYPTAPILDFLGSGKSLFSVAEFADASEMWVQPYTEVGYNATDFKNEIADLWNQTSDLYEMLHAFVLHKLKQYYPDDIDGDEEFIPAHLLGERERKWEYLK